MTQLLEQALTEIKKLPESEQDAIASLILEEIADDERWQESFARSQDQLARLAAKITNPSTTPVASPPTWAALSVTRETAPRTRLTAT